MRPWQESSSSRCYWARRYERHAHKKTPGLKRAGGSVHMPGFYRVSAKSMGM